MIPRALWKLWFLLVFIFSFLFLYPFFFIFLSSKKWFGAAFQLLRMWAFFLAYTSGIFPSIKRETPSKKIPHPCVFVSNHISYLDIILSYVIIPRYFISIGKQELDKAPLFRIFFQRMNILVNRKSAKDSHRAFVRSCEEIDKGHSVLIFPEATISSKGILMPFKNGAFKLAIEKQIPIVPIIFLNNWKLLQNGGFLTSHGRPGIAKIFVKSPIETKGMTQIDLLPLRNKIHFIIAQSLQEKS